MGPDVNDINAINEIQQLIYGNCVPFLVLGELIGAAPGPCHDHEWPDMPRHIVEAGEYKIHQVEIDLPQAEGIDATELRHRGWREAGLCHGGGSSGQLCKRGLCHVQFPVQTITLRQQFFAVATQMNFSLKASLMGNEIWWRGQDS